MTRTQNLLLTVAAMILICCVGINIIATWIIPEYGLPKRSYLEGRDYQQVPGFSLQSVVAGTFQTESEQFFADHIPLRERTLNINAKIQRGMIVIANAPFRFASYQTYFGSSYLYTPASGAVAEAPYSQKTYSKALLNKTALQYSSLIEKHPEYQWLFAIPERPGTLACSPGAQLTSQPASYQWFHDNFLNELTSRCQIVDLSYSDTKDFYNNYFLTDHHWQVMGAYRAYNAITCALGNTPVQVEAYYRVFNGPYWGSAARSGICPEGPGDTGFDAIYKQSPLSLFVDGKEAAASWLGGSNGLPEGTYEPIDTYANFYAHYFHNDAGEIIIENELAPNKELLIIGDSFTNSMERFFSENYRTVHVLDLRHFEGTVEDYLETHGRSIDDVVFIISAAALSSSEVTSAL